jgi:hypothetical protein
MPALLLFPFSPLLLKYSFNLPRKGVDISSISITGIRRFHGNFSESNMKRKTASPDRHQGK